jgi:hypothetical protein
MELSGKLQHNHERFFDYEYPSIPQTGISIVHRALSSSVKKITAAVAQPTPPGTAARNGTSQSTFPLC